MIIIKVIIDWRLIAPSTAPGHLRAFHKFKSRTSWVQYKTCTLHKRKPYKHNPKGSPFGIALVKKWQIKLGDAGTIDRFGLAFQYQIKTIIKKNGQKQSQIKNII